MKYVLVITLTALLSGCWQTVNNNDIDTAIRICGGIDNVVQIDANFAGGETVKCSDRTTVYMSERSK